MYQERKIRGQERFRTGQQKLLIGQKYQGRGIEDSKGKKQLNKSF